MSQTETLQEELGDWGEYQQKRPQNQTIREQVATRYPLSYEFLKTVGSEVLEHITWEEIASIDRALQPKPSSTWDERQMRPLHSLDTVRKEFPKLAAILEAEPQPEIEDAALEALAFAALRRTSPIGVVFDVRRETRRKTESYGHHSSDVIRPRSYYGDQKQPLAQQ